MKRIIYTLISLLLINLSLQAETIKGQTKEYIKQQWIDMCKTINQQCPIPVDEYTTLYSVTFYNWTMTNVYHFNLDLSDLSRAEKDSLLLEMKRYLKESIPSIYFKGNYNFNIAEMVAFMKELAIKFKYVLFDGNKKLIGLISFDYRDFQQASNSIIRKKNKQK